MTMCCPLSEGDGDGPECFTDEIRCAARPHRCGECGGAIARGQHYELAKGMWDKSWSTYKTCLMCKEIRDHFGCSGWVYGQVWEDITQNFFPDMSAGGPCMEGLSPAAKAHMIDERMKWLFENGGCVAGARPMWHPPLVPRKWMEMPGELSAPELHGSKYTNEPREESAQEQLARERHWSWVLSYENGLLQEEES